MPETAKISEQIRKEMELKGYGLSQEEFEETLSHTRRKLHIIGKDSDYFPLLLEDEIKACFFRNRINAATILLAFS